jgi:hypothetical protein
VELSAASAKDCNVRAFGAILKTFSFLTRPLFMDRDREKLALEEKLARCQALAKEFPDGPTAEMIRDIEKEIRDQLRSLKKRRP